jgi:hypothetical protein
VLIFFVRFLAREYLLRSISSLLLSVSFSHSLHSIQLQKSTATQTEILKKKRKEE